MPRVGVPNNASGVNNFDHFAAEPAYGEKTKLAQLAGGAPMAGSGVASGPIQAPKRAGRQAVKGTPQAAPEQQAPPPQEPSYDARLAQYWQGIAAIPGASPLVQQYAQIAMQRAANG